MQRKPEKVVKANEPDDFLKENTTEKVEESTMDVKDEVCPDDLYEEPAKQYVSMGTQTLESRVRPPAPRKGVVDYYALT